MTICFVFVTSIFFITFLTWFIFFLFLPITQLGIFFLVMLPFGWLLPGLVVTRLIGLTSRLWLSFELCCDIMLMNFCLLVTSSFKSLFQAPTVLCYSSVFILQSRLLFMAPSFFNDRNSSMKYSERFKFSIHGRTS